ncbi:NAD(P)H-quinone oxidoreductase [Allokutzneria sp. NRRL B-24872]|uniref:NAD(P)H-quinone oxidoreductase n=1 Tax=Allokutzneria sp. NRRL B-24872 TaxID=1137961 RepID=UPI000A363B78|nr:NAD(P)H-quinone oxidoreductase [Allokutzneria sp. NRRL B-24872]
MQAIVIREPGGPEVLRWAPLPDPKPGKGEVLIEVTATAVNRADLLQRKGFYPPPPGASKVLGLECSGTVLAVGPEVSGWKPGNQVCALLAGGGYAERVVVPAAQLLPVPQGVDLVTAAGLPEVACTVWSNLVMNAGLTEGETLLVHGGAGGIGTFAVQVGRALGAKVAVTAGTDTGLERCRELGAEIAVNYRTEDFVEVVRKATGDRGADVVLDNMGAAYFERNVEVLAQDGRLVVIGLQGGVKSELNLGTLLTKRATVSATALRSRPVDGRNGKGEIVAQVRKHLWPLIANGTVKPVVHTTLPVKSAGDAHRILEAGGVIGKIILAVRSS